MQQSPRRLNLLNNHLSAMASATSVPNFKLTYLPVRARAENIRCASAACFHFFSLREGGAERHMTPRTSLLCLYSFSLHPNSTFCCVSGEGQRPAFFSVSTHARSAPHPPRSPRC